METTGSALSSFHQYHFLAVHVCMIRVWHASLKQCSSNLLLMLQALGLLYWHGYNVDQALADLPNFAPTPNNWTVEDLVLFEQAFHFHGKNFQKIHELVSRVPMN